MEVVKDHLGNKFSSVTEMCKYYNIERTTYVGRLKRGYSVEEALTIPVKTVYKRNNTVYKDNNNNKYNTVYEMCYANDVTVAQRYCRIKSNRQELALDSTVSLRGKKVEDYKGNKFNSITELARYYNTYNNYIYRQIRKGITIAEITRELDTNQNQQSK